MILLMGGGRGDDYDDDDFIDSDNADDGEPLPEHI